MYCSLENVVSNVTRQQTMSPAGKPCRPSLLQRQTMLSAVSHASHALSHRSRITSNWFGKPVRTGRQCQPVCLPHCRIRKQRAAQAAFRNPVESQGRQLKRARQQDWFDHFLQRLPDGTLKEYLDLYQQLIRRVAVTVIVVALLRFGHFVPLPNLDLAALTPSGPGSLMLGQGTASLFHVGIHPYILASMMYALAYMLQGVPGFTWTHTWIEQSKSQGLEGYYWVKRTLGLIGAGFAFIMAVYESLGLQQFATCSRGFIPVCSLYMTAGAVVMHYLAEYISEYGIGDGTTWILCLSVVTGYGQILRMVAAHFVTAVVPVWKLAAAGLCYGALIAGMIFITFVQLRVPMVYYRTRRTKAPVSSPLTPIADSSPGDDMTAYIPLRLTSGLGSLLWANVALEVIFTSQLFVGLGPSFVSWLSTGWASTLLFSCLVFLVDFGALGLENNAKNMADYLMKIEAGIDGVSPGEATEKFLVRKERFCRVWGALFLSLLVLASRIVDQICFPGLRANVGTMMLLIISLVTSTSRQVYALLQAPKVSLRLLQQRKALDSVVGSTAGAALYGPTL